MQGQHTTDIALIDLIKKGDLGAFDEVVTRYTQKVHNLAFRISRSELDTEEIVQDVFVTVFFKIDKFEGKSAFSSWLYRVTANTALMRLRKNKQNASSSLDEAVENGNLQSLVSKEDTELGVQQAEIQTALAKALSQIPEEYQSVFVLRDIDRLSNEEVSEILNVSVPAIKSRLHRARLMLRKSLANFFEEFTGLQANLDQVDEQEELKPLVLNKRV